MRRTMIACLVPVLVATGVSSAQMWDPGPSLSIGRSLAGVCTDPSGTIYAVGGRTGNCCPWGMTGTVEVLSYDKALGYTAWASTASLNTPRAGCAAVCVGGYLYAIAGGDGNAALPNVERLDLLDGKAVWLDKAVPDLPVGLGAPGAAVDKLGRIWVIGVTEQDETVAYSFDPSRPDHWSDEPAPVTGRVNNCAVSLTVDQLGRLYFMGGCTATEHLPDVWRLDPVAANPQWQPVADISGDISNTDPVGLGADGRIYVAGGWLPGFTNRVVRYDPADDTWEPWVSLSEARNGNGLVKGRDGSIMVIGGEVGGLRTTTSVERLTPPCGAANTRPDLLDMDGDGMIGIIDFLYVLERWGNCDEN